MTDKANQKQIKKYIETMGEIKWATVNKAAKESSNRELGKNRKRDSVG